MLLSWLIGLESRRGTADFCTYRGSCACKSFVITVSMAVHVIDRPYGERRFGLSIHHFVVLGMAMFRAEAQ